MSNERGITRNEVHQSLIDEWDGYNNQLGNLSGIVGIDTKSFPIQAPEMDDTARLQRALDYLTSGGILSFTEKTYTISSSLLIKYNNIILDLLNSVITYNGSGYALDVIPLNGTTYPIGFLMRNGSFTLTTDGATGIHWRFSYSSIFNVGVSLKGNNQTGWEILGDVNGTGPYYNNFQGLKVQGNRNLGTTTNQKGVVFTYDASTPTRCPNANTFIGGRIGQVDKAWTINGNKNRLISPTCEGTISTVFDINHATSNVGCNNNSVQDAYVEGASGVNVFVIGANANYTSILYPYITSIGAGQLFTDSGVNTTFLYGNNTYVPADGYKLKQNSSIKNPHVDGVYPGFVYKDTGNNTEVLVRNASQASSANSRFQAYDNTNSRSIMAVGDSQAQFYPRILKLNNGDVGVYVGSTAPEGYQTAPVGSIYLYTGGAAGTTFYVKENGTGNTGWVAK